MTFGRLPLLVVLFGLVPVSIAVAGHRERESTMSSSSEPIALTAHLVLLSSISFGGVPTVLPDVHNFVVATHGWIAEFVVGSAVRQDHKLVLGYYSVHTSADALREGEARIAAIRTRLVQEGRL
jgi:hypothetical protein